MPLIEVCVDTLEGLQAAQAGGADRVELCSRLDLDGLSPDPELLRAALELARVPLVIMVRPSAGDFLTRPDDLASMRREVEALREQPVGGLVLGLLDAAGRVDRQAVAELVEAARPLPVVFHRAFDRCRDLNEALEDLIELGVARILTSGGAASAYAGRARLRELVERAAGRIEILAGGGIRDHNVQALLAATGVSQLHASVLLRR